MDTSDTSGSPDQEVPAALGRYFDADPASVRDIVSEARRMRAAMGKSMPSHWAPHSDKVVVCTAPEINAPAEAALAEKVIEIGDAVAERTKTPQAARPVPVAGRMPPAKPADPGPQPAGLAAEPQARLDEEIRQFAYGRTACTSIDIIDFVRYLKDKGYSLQECIVLEKIYVSIEERKKEARFAIEREIEGLIDATHAPEEPVIQGLLQRLIKSGLVFEEEDVRRMVRDAALRRA